MIQHILTVAAALAGQPLGPVPIGDSISISQDSAMFTPVDLAEVRQRHTGLAGSAVVNDQPADVIFIYQTGRLWPAELIPELFYDGEHRAAVQVTLAGLIDIPTDMTVKIWHAGGGVNGDTAELIVGGRSLGVVGDDTLKNVITTAPIPAGTYAVQWTHVTQGTCQPHYLKFENAETGDAIECFHLGHFVPDSEFSGPVRIIDVNNDPSEWGTISDPSRWYSVSLVEVPASPSPDWAGEWRADFANGIVQTYTLSGGGTATVHAGNWHDTGSIEIGDGHLIIRFTEDRAERWTRVGHRMVVEHWFPAAQLPTRLPVMGIAEQIRTATTE